MSQQASFLPLGFSESPPCSPWGINFGGGVNSTALIIEARRRGLRPDWILFADTGSERNGTLGYDAGEHRRITKACLRGDDPNFVAWYPLVAWGLPREKCTEIVESEKMLVIKSSCFMCPNMKTNEWKDLKTFHPDKFTIAKEIESKAISAGNAKQGGLIRGSMKSLRDLDAVVLNQQDLFESPVTEDRCHHGGCFT